MTKLSVNVNKLATLRNSRGKNTPDVIKGALDIIQFGAEGITVHPRPDERHIRKVDVYELKKRIGDIELNVEGYPSDDFIGLVNDVKPAQATLVPDPPDVLTSNAGWQVRENEAFLRDVVRRLKDSGTRISVFIDPETSSESDYRVLKDVGVHRVELFTEKYADCFGTPEESRVLGKYREAAERAKTAGLGVNAGHDLNSENLTKLIHEIPWSDEVSIGHALISDALYWGLEKTVAKYLECIRSAESRSAKVEKP